MRNREGVSDGAAHGVVAVIKPSGAVGGFVYVQFRFNDGNRGRIRGAVGIASVGVRPADLGGVGLGVAVLVSAFVKYPRHDAHHEGIVVRVVVCGDGGIPEVQGHIAARAAGGGEGGRVVGKGAVEVRAEQTAAAGCRGDDLMADIFQPGGQVVEDGQGLSDALGQSHQQVEGDFVADGVLGGTHRFGDGGSRQGCICR